MGVKDLWSYLSPLCEKKSLWELQGQTVAIDLSCWICDSQKQCTPVLRPYIRSCLLMLGIRPVFVLDGEAPDIKQNEIRRRINGACEGEPKGGKIKRSRLNGIIVQCQKLLETLGIGSVKSPGEAEAMCARLNESLVVDGCITQDSDCFLYGAKVVYRNFSAACGGKGVGFAVDAYDMVRIQECLGLDREGLVALALLCGCDYQDSSHNGARGVAGIGIETASQLIIGLSKTFGNVLSRLKSWKSDPYYSKLEGEVVAVDSGPTCIQCGHRGNLGRHDRVGCKSCDYKEGCKINCKLPIENSLASMPIEKRKLLMLELKVRVKAAAYPGFPSQSIIDEFLAPVPHPIKLKPSDISWGQPHLTSFLSDNDAFWKQIERWERRKIYVEIAEKYLGWPQDYSLVKFLPLLTRWKVMQESKAQEILNPNDVLPVSIKKKRVSKGVHCFEVEWNLIPPVLETNEFSTLEPVYLFEKAYPSLVQEFFIKKGKEQSKPKGADKKLRTQTKNSKGCSCSGSVKNGHICQFFHKKSGGNSEGGECNYENQSSAISNVTKMLENASIKNRSSSSSDVEQLSDSDDDFDPLELSAIINGIVERNSNTHRKNGGIVKASTLECQLNEPRISRFKSVELEDTDKPLSSKFECCVKEELKKAEIAIIDGDMKMLCKQLENVDLEKAIRKDESGEDSSDELCPMTSPMKGQLFEPNFDLGMSALLQSPESTSERKSMPNLLHDTARN